MLDTVLTLFVCLFNRSVRGDTRMGPEGTKLKQKPEPGIGKYVYVPLDIRFDSRIQ